ncbi:MAG: histidine kinase [Spirochaetales bacterium]|nr:histidine kinase [Spirochaetales bacterium]
MMKKHIDLFGVFNILILVLIPVIVSILFGFTLNLIFEEFSGTILMMVLTNAAFLGGGAVITYIIARQLLNRLNAVLILLLCFFLIFGVSLTGFIFIFIRDPLLFLVEGMKTLSYLFINFLFILAITTVLTGNLVYQKQLGEKEKTILAEKVLRMEMERKVLVSQINPHFLFNSLNLGVSLLHDPLTAEKVFVRLSALLRYSLDAVDKERVSLEEELEQIQNYLSIQKLRFEDRLQYEIQGNGSFPLPPLTLQPLVENSIKHHMKKKGALGIFIHYGIDGQENKLEVYDSYEEIKSPMIGKGVGLMNVKKRVEMAGGTFSIKKGRVSIVFTA